ncbi:renalase isoform X6 [Brienomyrus brachyistius]|uniref:renalase isoform X6 n=1 Tax=Brienomyrus brachyistius TaxID=42636 RepID=UPI0020B183DE|nr:renalase isoform X6 [Brienomyrus brachyistius]
MPCSELFPLGGSHTGPSLTSCEYFIRQTEEDVAMPDRSASPGRRGGRMCTSSSPDDPNCTADLGAQYVTATPYHSETHGSFYAELSSHGILRPLLAPVEGMAMTEEGTRNFVAPKGASSIVKHYLRESGAEVHFCRQVTHVQRKGPGWEVCVEGGQAESFDAVVLTVPVPQILQLRGDVPSWSPSSGPSLVVHTCVTFGLNHLEMAEGEVKTLIMAELQKILPCLPEPTSVEVRRWRYSQVVNVVDGSLGQITLHLSPLLVCGGDGFTNSNFDGCIESALKVVEILKSSL